MAFQVAHSPILAPIATPIYTGGAVSLAAQVLALGPDYMLDLTQSGQMFQTSTSLSTAASATDDPVGLMADYAATGGKSIEGFLAGQPELWDDTAITLNGDAENLGGGSYRIYSSDGSYSAVTSTSNSLTIGDNFLVSYTIDSVASGGVRFGNLGELHNSAGTYSQVTETNTTTPSIKRNGGVTDAIVSNVSVKKMPTLWTQATALQRPLLGAGNSLVLDGNDDNIGVDFPGGAGPSDCSLWVAFKGTDTKAMLAALGSASQAIGIIQDGAGTALSAGAGTPTAWVDATEVTTRNALSDAVTDDQWRIVEFRAPDFSGWSALTLSGYTASSWGVDGSIGPRVLICSTAIANANRTLIDQWMREPLV